MSLVSCVGGEGNLLDETPRQCRMLELPHPILTQRRARASCGRTRSPTSARARSRTHFRGRRAEPERGELLRDALDELCARGQSRAIADGATHPHPQRSRRRRRTTSPIPSLLAVARRAPPPHPRGHARARRASSSRRGEPREVAHLALLVGYGAGAVNPYLALETDRRAAPRQGAARRRSRRGQGARELRQGAQEGPAQDHVEDGHQRRRRATRARRSSRRSASIRSSSTAYFTGTASRIRGVGLARDRRGGARAARARVYGPRRRGAARRRRPLSTTARRASATSGTRARSRRCRRRCASRTRRATRSTRGSINEQARAPMTLRGLWDLGPAGPPVPLDEVEPATQHREALRHRRDVASAASRRRRTRTSPSR